MRNDGTTVRYDGIRGSLEYLPSESSHAPELPSPTSWWFVPAGWADWSGSWVEPWQVQREQEDDGRGSAGVHDLLSVG